MALPTDDRRLVFVVPFNSCPFSYGWNTNADAGVSSALGHVPLESLAGVGVFGANRPKPARMTIQRTVGSEGSFVDWQSIDSAKSAGYTISKAAKYGPIAKETASSQLVGAEVAPGVDVAWTMTKRQIARLGGDRTALGIRVLQQSTANRACTGVSKWYGINEPQGAVSSDEVGQISVKYVAASALDNLPDGWSSDSDNTASDPTLAPNA